MARPFAKSQANGDLFHWQRADAFRVAEPPMLVAPATTATTSVNAPVHVDHSWG